VYIGYTFAALNTFCKTTITDTLENVSNVNETIYVYIWIIKNSNILRKFEEISTFQVRKF